MYISKNPRVIICGGSISGSTLAVLLTRMGINVKILERSKHAHVGRGAGIVLPSDSVNYFISHDLFDENIPRLPFYSRSFHVRTPETIEDRKIWQQDPFSGVAFNWSDIYRNLRKRISSESYLVDEEVKTITKIDNEYVVETNNKKYCADLVVAADGVNSLLRQMTFERLATNYAGYVAWRGVIESAKVSNEALFNQHVSYYVYKNGHLLLYKIPKDHGTTLINWVMYEKCGNLDPLFIDKNYIKHQVSLPPDSFQKTHLDRLHHLSDSVLPEEISQIIKQTRAPFLQAIYDTYAPSCYKNNICFIGDAGAVLRPHTSSGALKGMSDAIKLAQVIKNHKDSNFHDQLHDWSHQQTKYIEQ